MKKQTVKQFFEFLEKREKAILPFLYKLILSPETLTEEELTVEQDLDLTNIDIDTLPEGLTVKGVLDLENSLIKYLPVNLTIEESLVLSNAIALKELPDRLTVGRDLWLDDTYIMDVPRNLKVERDLFVGRSNILAKYGTMEAVGEAIRRKGGYVGGQVLDIFNREDGEF